MSEPQRFVVDATVAVKWFLPEVQSEHAALWLNPKVKLLAPDVLVDQVSMVMWRRSRPGSIKPETAQRVIKNLIELPIQWVPDAELAVAALEVAAATTRTYAESLYFALAIREDIQVVTADHRWFQLVSTGRLRPWVRFVNDHPHPVELPRSKNINERLTRP